MKNLLLFISAILLPLLVLSCSKPSKEIYWYCASSMKIPAHELVKSYNNTGGNVVLITGGSGQILNKIISSQIGDIYTPASSHFFNKAVERGIVLENLPLVKQTPVFALRKGLRGIDNFNLLWQTHLPIATGNIRSMALGKTWDAIEKRMPAEMAEGFKRNISVTPVNVSQTVNYIKTGTIDAGFLFDSVARVNSFKFISIPPVYNQVEKSSLVLLSMTSDKKAAKAFINYIVKHKSFFKKYGFTLWEGL